MNGTYFAEYSEMELLRNPWLCLETVLLRREGSGQIKGEQLQYAYLA
jgi:hypothetical protein